MTDGWSRPGKHHNSTPQASRRTSDDPRSDPGVQDPWDQLRPDGVTGRRRTTWVRETLFLVSGLKSDFYSYNSSRTTPLRLVSGGRSHLAVGAGSPCLFSLRRSVVLRHIGLGREVPRVLSDTTKYFFTPETRNDDVSLQSRVSGVSSRTDCSCPPW